MIVTEIYHYKGVVITNMNPEIAYNSIGNCKTVKPFSLSEYFLYTMGSRSCPFTATKPNCIKNYIILMYEKSVLW